MRNYIVLFVGCLLFHLAGTWSLPLIDRDEPRFAEAAREMRERADFIVPYFNNQFRFDKPPLTYWLQVASYRVFGENDFAARFPTAVAAALVALVLFGWGKRLRDEKAGWWAAIIFTLSLQTFVHAKAAVNTKLGARDVTGAVGCQKDDTVRNFFHCSPAPGNDTPIAARFAQKLGLRFALLPGKVVRP